MKKVLPFFIVFFLMPIVLAEITITSDQHVYNLGNKIQAYASVLRDSNFDGLFKLTLTCENYKLNYFLTPISLESNFRTAIEVPEFAATSPMLGKCAITGDLLTNENHVVEEKLSDGFAITDQLSVRPVNAKITALPGATILIAGIVNEAFGNNVVKASAEVILDNTSYPVNAVDGKFNLTLQLPTHITSGKHTIKIRASDPKSNSGAATIDLDVTVVPTYVQIYLSSAKASPGSVIEITSSLYDQAGDLVNASLDLELTSPQGNKVFRKVVRSNEKINYESSQYTEPGIYTLASNYGKLFAQSHVNITVVREVRVRYGNETVFVENIGNVLFEDELTFMLQSDSNKYSVVRRVKIEPSKTLSIDLSKEVPFGIYDIIAPIKEGLNPITNRISEPLQGALESAKNALSNLIPRENVLASGVTIHDHRPVYKKVATGFASITAALVGSDGLLARHPLIAPMVLIVVLLALVFRYGRKPIMRLIKGKKGDENNEN